MRTRCRRKAVLNEVLPTKSCFQSNLPERRKARRVRTAAGSCGGRMSESGRADSDMAPTCAREP